MATRPTRWLLPATAAQLGGVAGRTPALCAAPRPPPLPCLTHEHVGGFTGRLAGVVGRERAGAEEVGGMRQSMQLGLPPHPESALAHSADKNPATACLPPLSLRYSRPVTRGHTPALPT